MDIDLPMHNRALNEMQNDGLHQVAILAIPVAAPSLADPFLQPNPCVLTIKIEALRCADDAWTSVDACVDQSGDENIGLVVLVSAARLHQIPEISEQGVDHLLRRIDGKCGRCGRHSGDDNVFGRSHGFDLSEK
ncbi:hypothetical protein [Sphingomonas sp.]|uniref:hypothetical protein n=1 Tax=Sphingomonas sp. TaxID=28214 RepID=UPI003F71C6A3